MILRKTNESIRLKGNSKYSERRETESARAYKPYRKCKLEADNLTANQTLIGGEILGYCSAGFGPSNVKTKFTEKVFA